MVVQENKLSPLKRLNHSIDDLNSSFKLYCIKKYPEDEFLQSMISDMLYFESKRAYLKARKLIKKGRRIIHSKLG